LNQESTLPTTLQGLDANHDGLVTPDELFNSSGNASLGEFLTALRTEMAIGAGGEDISTLPGVALGNLSRRPTCAGLSGSPINPTNLADVVSALNTCAIPVKTTP
jgi:hypothetical protein